MNVVEGILQALRAWVMAATGLADGKVLVRNAGNTQPALPFANVWIPSIGAREGIDSVHVIDVAGDIGRVTVGQRLARAEVEFIGEDSQHLASLAHIYAGSTHQLTHTFLDEDDVPIGTVTASIRRASPPRDTTTFLETAHQIRTLLELEIAYTIALADASPPVVEMTNASITATISLGESDFETVITLES